MVLADDRLFPSVFGRRHDRFGTPVVSLVVTGLILTGLCALDFRQLVAAAALVQSLSYLLIYAAFFKLRGQETDRNPKGFRMAIASRHLAVMVVPNVLLVGLVARQRLLPNRGLDFGQALVDLAILTSALVTYALVKRRARRAPAPAVAAVGKTDLDR
jgi:amino acid transporter